MSLKRHYTAHALKPSCPNPSLRRKYIRHYIRHYIRKYIRPASFNWQVCVVLFLFFCFCLFVVWRGIIYLFIYCKAGHHISVLFCFPLLCPLLLSVWFVIVSGRWYQLVSVCTVQGVFLFSCTHCCVLNSLHRCVWFTRKQTLNPCVTVTPCSYNFTT